MNHRVFAALLLFFNFFGCALLPVPNSDEPNEIIDFPDPPVKSLPRGWSTGDYVLAGWGTHLNAVLGSLPDTSAVVEYWEEEKSLELGKKLPIQRARAAFTVATRLNTQTVELRFVNVDYIYSTTLHSADHYVLNEVNKKIEIKTTGYPRITSEDILRNKVLLVYGTPSGFDGVAHEFQDDKTVMGVRILDKQNLAINLRSVEVEAALNEALYKVYSEEGLESKKREILKDFDL